MFNSIVLDVLIGLMTIYLILSLVITAVNEGISSLLSWRSHTLEATLIFLLNGKNPLGPSDSGGGNVWAGLIYFGKVVRHVFTARLPRADGIGGLAAMFIAHPLTQSLIKGKDGLPSYIPKDVVSQVIVDVVAAESTSSSSTNPPNADGAAPPAATGATNRLQAVRAWANAGDASSPLQGVLRIFLQEIDLSIAGDTPNADAVRLAALRERIEDWFDNTMDRASGWYKRRVQYSLLIIAMLIVAVTNVDSIAIAKALYAAPALRQRLVETGVQIAKEKSQSQTASSQGVVLENSATGETGISGVGGVGLHSAVPASRPATLGVATDKVQSPEEKLILINQMNQQLEQRLKQLDGLGLPIGWDSHRPLDDDAGVAHALSFSENFNPLTVPGWLITAFAISLGAPFWFDMLSKIVNIRGSGPKPSTTN